MSPERGINNIRQYMSYKVRSVYITREHVLLLTHAKYENTFFPTLQNKYFAESPMEF
jgi:hypothetical protein